MSGAELKKILADKGVVKSRLAAQLNMRPQDLNARLNVKNVKVDFLREVEKAVGFKLEKTDSDKRFEESVPYFVHQEIVELYKDALAKIEELERKNIQLEKYNAVLEYKLSAFTNIEKEKKAVG